MHCLWQVTASLVDVEEGFEALPTSNVVRYFLEDGSGTEPKIKIYYSIKGADKDASEKKLEEIQNTIQTKLGLK
mgnify:CR=1 FL=1